MTPIAARLSGLERTLIRRISEAAPPNALHLGLGQPDFPVPAAIRERVVQHLAGGHSPYTPNAGLLRLRELIASRHGAPGPDWILVTAGVEEALFTAIHTLMGDGDEALLPDPGFPAYPAIVQLAGGISHSYQKLCDVPGRLTPQTRFVLVNTPANPTSAVLTEEDFYGLGEAVGDLPIISDEIYRSMSWEKPAPSIRPYVANSVVLDGLSKSHNLMGFRLGWVVAEPKLIQAMTTFHQYVISCAPLPAQIAAIAALEGVADAEVQQNFQILARRRRLMLDRLEGFEVQAEGAFYGWLKVGGDSLALAYRLLDRGVVTIPGIAFGPAGEGFLRLSYATDDSTLTQGLAIMREVLRESLD